MLDPRSHDRFLNMIVLITATLEVVKFPRLLFVILAQDNPRGILDIFVVCLLLYSTFFSNGKCARRTCQDHKRSNHKPAGFLTAWGCRASTLRTTYACEPEILAAQTQTERFLKIRPLGREEGAGAVGRVYRLVSNWIMAISYKG